MATLQTLRDAPNGTLWSRKVGNTTYFLWKINGRYEVWTAGTNTHSPVTIEQALVYLNQYNLINTNTAASVPSPTSTPKPAPAPKPVVKPKTVTTPAKTPTPTPAPVTKPADVPTTVLETNDIVINPEPLTVPIIDIKTGKVTSNVTVQPGPITIEGQKILSDGTVVPNTDTNQDGTRGLSGAAQSTAAKATAQDQAQFLAQKDWRVRLALAPGAKYLYNDPAGDTILQPLSTKNGTDGVIFPYTPSISVNYAANYEGTSLTHTNYKIYQYQNSSVDQVQITCDFTAQDVNEANYVLAVIHFFRSMTKMFYGQDSDPKNGTPPPLCYLYGLGGYQFEALPLAISGFNYSLPQDVDYIKTTGASAAGTPQPSVQNSATNTDRLGTGIAKGGVAPSPAYGSTPTQDSQSATWVPTKIQLAITCLPIMSRNQVSNYFSLKNYANGKLIQGTKRLGGGFW